MTSETHQYVIKRLSDGQYLTRGGRWSAKFEADIGKARVYRDRGKAAVSIVPVKVPSQMQGLDGLTRWYEVQHRDEFDIVPVRLVPYGRIE